MNQHDRDNLNFLLKSSPEILRDWYSKVSEDDIAYAQELLNAYALELRDRSRELLVETRLSAMSTYIEANAVLSQFLK